MEEIIESYRSKKKNSTFINYLKDVDNQLVPLKIFVLKTKNVAESCFLKIC